MTLENQLISKTYFETFIENNEKRHPVQVLGDAYLTEQKNEVPDLSYIRFAQGEVYFHNKDYEAAIFKWENINNDLEPWAKKNMADSYFELDILSTAEEIYKSIITDSLTLNSEILLQLLSLYIEQGNLESAVFSIKEAVSLNPDYPNVTNIARSFFEKYGDWANAVELAVNEGIRTGSLQWFQVLNAYVENGHTKSFAPGYFQPALQSLIELDQASFERLATSLWISYTNHPAYLEWIKDINLFLLNVDVENGQKWKDLSAKYKETSLTLMSGDYLLNDLYELVPNLLSNWSRIAYPSDVLFASSAVLAWNEVYPSTISPSIVNEAEKSVKRTNNYENGLENSLELLYAIINWAEQHDVDVSQKLKWSVSWISDMNVRNLLVAGADERGKSAFINTLLGTDIVQSASPSTVMFKDGQDIEIDEVTYSETRKMNSLADFYEHNRRIRQAGKSIFDFKVPSNFLSENRLSLIDTPIMNSHSWDGKSEGFACLELADHILYVLNGDDSISEIDRTNLERIKKQVSNLSIDFILNFNQAHNETEAIEVFEQTSERIKKIFPNSNVFAFSINYESKGQLRDLKHFFKANIVSNPYRIDKILNLTRQTITHLLKRRVETEQELIDSINWNEEMVAKLNGAINQLSDLEAEKSKLIRNYYLRVKDEMREDLLTSIPEILKDCSKLIKEDSDFRNIHVELNDEMNRRVQSFINENVLPDYYKSVQEWMDYSQEAFNDGQLFLNEMGESFNAMYGEERIKLECDFKVLDDWRRDADRMSSRIHLEKVNILLRFKPSQFLLKSAGKLFGAIPQNKTLLYNQYKKYLENENYDDIAETITNKIMLQFDLFEQSLERDVTIFFKNPFQVLKQNVAQSENEIAVSQDKLDKMRTNPEWFHDPLTLFELRLRQYEWMIYAEKNHQLVH